MSHPRSGTHFLINSILSSNNIFFFPKVRPSFLSLENLMLSHDKDVLNEWEKNINLNRKNKKILIFKTHCSYEEIIYFIKNESVFKKEATLIKNIIKNSLIIYIKRNVYDTLRSWYFFCKSDNIVSVNSSSTRHKNLTFSDFLKLKNLHKINNLKFNLYDENVIKYLKYHHNSCKKINLNIFEIEYEKLKYDYKNTMIKLIQYLIKYKLKNISHNMADYNLKQPTPSKFNFLRKIKILNFLFMIKKNDEVFNKTNYELNISKKDKLFISKNYY